VNSLAQKSQRALRWAQVYFRWSSMSTRGIIAPHLLPQGTASCLHVFRCACDKSNILNLVSPSRHNSHSVIPRTLLRWLYLQLPQLVRPFATVLVMYAVYDGAHYCLFCLRVLEVLKKTETKDVIYFRLFAVCWNIKRKTVGARVP